MSFTCLNAADIGAHGQICPPKLELEANFLLVILFVFRMGAKWLHIRSILNPRMLKPKHVSSYTDTINEVVTDFIDRVAWLRAKSGQGVMVNDLTEELYKFAFEGRNFEMFSV